jgi:hypothetical protein
MTNLIDLETPKVIPRCHYPSIVRVLCIW